MLAAEQRRRLLEVAESSIREGLRTGLPLPVDVGECDSELQAERATFVTLHTPNGELRGCIGTLEAHEPLVRSVAGNAYNAAFKDPRFSPLRESELGGLQLEISILSPPEPLAFDSEAVLLRQIRPGVDGLILEDGDHRGTFLPSVWESLPDPEAFWRHLKMKAWLPPEHWSDRLRVSRYTTEVFGGRIGETAEQR